MYDLELVSAIIKQIEVAVGRIERRFQTIKTADDFLNTDDGLDKLDAICMMLIATGESLKHLDKITNAELLSKYPSVDWKGAKGVRDVISHHYFDLNAEAIFNICQERIPGLSDTLRQMSADIKQQQSEYDPKR